VDANNLTLSGGDFDGFDMARLWGPEYVKLLEGLDELPVSVDAETLSLLMVRPDFDAELGEFLDEVDSETFQEGDDDFETVAFSFGELKASLPFSLYSRFSEMVMVIGDVEEVLERCLTTD
jgi:hypothetical protein